MNDGSSQVALVDPNGKKWNACENQKKYEFRIVNFLMKLNPQVHPPEGFELTGIHRIIETNN